jgi:hypothetical protein
VVDGNPSSPVSVATAALRAAVFDARPLARYQAGVDAVVVCALAGAVPAAALDAMFGRAALLAAPALQQ